MESRTWVPTGVGGTWWRGPARFDRGWIVLQADRAEEYFPYEEPALLHDLWDVSRPQEAVAFARRYGLLWHGPGSEEHRERFTEWEEAIQEIKAVLQFSVALQMALEGDAEMMAFLRAGIDGLEEKPPIVSDNPDDEAVLGYASHMIALSVSQGLKGVEQRLVALAAYEWGEGDGPVAPGAPGKFVYAVESPTLLGYAYHTVAMLLTSGEQLATCPECGRIFALTDKRQQYCSKLCAGRARYRRFVEKRKAQPAD